MSSKDECQCKHCGHTCGNSSNPNGKFWFPCTLFGRGVANSYEWAGMWHLVRSRCSYVLRLCLCSWPRLRNSHTLLSGCYPRDKVLPAYLARDKAVHILLRCLILRAAMRALYVYYLGFWFLYHYAVHIAFRYNDSLCTMWTLYHPSAIRFIDGYDVSALRTFEFDVHAFCSSSCCACLNKRNVLDDVTTTR